MTVHNTLTELANEVIRNGDSTKVQGLPMDEEMSVKLKGRVAVYVSQDGFKTILVADVLNGELQPVVNFDSDGQAHLAQHLKQGQLKKVPDFLNKRM